MSHNQASVQKIQKGALRAGTAGSVAGSIAGGILGNVAALAALAAFALAPSIARADSVIGGQDKIKEKEELAKVENASRFLSANAAALITSFSGSTADVDVLDYGVVIAGGTRFWKTSVGSVLFYGEAGAFYGKSDFYAARQETFVVPLSLTLAYEFDICRSFAVRIGVHGGATFFNGYPTKDDPESALDYHDVAYGGGAQVGLKWRFGETKTWSLDLGYKLTFLSGIKFANADESAAGELSEDTVDKRHAPVTSQITLGVSYRF
jgi:hypothetical protein